MKISPLEDGKSNVELIDHMGHDLRVANAARVSMHKESTWDEECACGGNCWEPGCHKGCSPTGRKVLKNRDSGLLSFLSRNDHWTPFGHCMVTLRLKMPFFVAREWFRHEVGFVRNEMSRRYVTDEPEFYQPSKWRAAAEGVKQGSSDQIVMDNSICESIADSSSNESLSDYKYLLDRGVAPEQARMVLPMNTYTEFYETGSLYAYARLCRQRLPSDAQQEIRSYAKAVSRHMAYLFPHSWRVLMAGVEDG